MLRRLLNSNRTKYWAEALIYPVIVGVIILIIAQYYPSDDSKEKNEKPIKKIQVEQETGGINNNPIGVQINNSKGSSTDVKQLIDDSSIEVKQETNGINNDPIGVQINN